MGAFSWTEWERRIKQFVNWHWVLVVSLIITGIVLVLYASLSLYFHQQQVFHARVAPNLYISLWLPFLKNFGYTILAGGFFAAFTKSFQMIGIFREEIKKVIFSEEVLVHAKKGIRDIALARDFLALASDEYKKTVWKNMTLSVFAYKNKQLQEDFSESLFKMIPSKTEYIQREYYVKYHITQHDPNHIAFIQEISYDIYCETGCFDFIKRYVVWRVKDDAKDKGEVIVEYFRIDGEDCVLDFKPLSFEQDGYTVAGQRLEKKGIKKERARVKSRVRIIHSLKSNPYWRYEFRKLTEGFHIEVIFDPTQFNVNLELTDESLTLTDVLLASPKPHKRTKDLLFPTDGYIIIVNPKIRQHEDQ